jgi:hypothetical protein
MIRYRSAAFFGRLYAPEIMMGMQSQDEVIDTNATVVNGHESPALENFVLEDLQKLYDEKLPLMNKEQMDNANRIIANKEEGNYRKLYSLLTSLTNE